MIDLSIIIVSYNTKDFLEKCLTSLEQHPAKKYTSEILVVDNNSKDQSTVMVEDKFPYVVLIKNKENMGFSKANNIGIKKAQGRYLLFLNSDTEVKKDSLDTMITFMEDHNDAGAATCKVVMPNGKLDDASHRGFPTPWNAFSYFTGLAKLFPNSMLFNGYNYAWKDLDKTHQIDALAGAFMLVRKQAGEQVGWWDEDYFFYGEDLDFCYELQQKGWNIYYVPTAEILHYKGVSGGIKGVSKEITPASKETKRKATYERFRAMKVFYGKHYKDKYPFFITWLVMKGIDLKLYVTMQKHR